MKNVLKYIGQKLVNDPFLDFMVCGGDIHCRWI